MLTITYAFFVKSPFGTSVAAFLVGAPKARSDTCAFVAVRRPYGRWRRGFFG